MALSADTWWEVRTTGSDSNGGGFVQGASGTDRSQQASAHASLTTLSVIAASADTITVSLSDYTVTANDVGNILQITGGTATPGFYQILSVNTGLNTWTLDRSAGTTGQTVVGAMGGALLTWDKAAVSAVVYGNVIWVKAGTYNSSATITLPAAKWSIGEGDGTTRLYGYDTTRGDAPTGSNRPILNLTTNTDLKGLTFASGASGVLAHFIVDCNSLGTSVGIETRNYARLINVTVREFTSYGIRCSGLYAHLITCECHDGTSAASGAFADDVNGSNFFITCWAHDNDCPGFHVSVSGPGATFLKCIASNNSGASSDGFRGVQGVVLDGCVAYNNGRDGYHHNNQVLQATIRNSIFYGNAGYGIDVTTGSLAMPGSLAVDYNAYGSNTSGATSGLDNSNYTAHDVTLTGDPFTDAANDDFTLNNTAGAGAACRAAGVPGAWNVGAITKTGYLDIGVFQHQDTGSSSTPLAWGFFTDSQELR